MHPTDPRTRVAARAAYLRTAQDALTRASTLADDDAQRAHLTEITSAVARQQRAADVCYADLREADARQAQTTTPEAQP